MGGMWQPAGSRNQDAEVQASLASIRAKLKELNLQQAANSKELVYLNAKTWELIKKVEGWDQ